MDLDIANFLSHTNTKNPDINHTMFSFFEISTVSLSPFSNYYHVVYRSTKSSAVVNKPSKAPHVTDTNQLHIQSTNLPVPQVLNKQVKICDMK